MKQALSAAIAAVLAGLCVGSASAGPVYSQPPVPLDPDDIKSGWTSTLIPGNSGYVTWDDFTLNTAADISAVAFRGFAWDGDDRSNNPVSLISVNWFVAIYSDNGGTPGFPSTPLGGWQLPAASVSTTFAGTSKFVVDDLGIDDVVNVYDMVFPLASPFAASAGTRYWVTAVSLQDSFYPFFSWTEGTGGDGLTAQCFYVGNVTQECWHRPGDRAFTLYTVPESSSLALALSAVGFAGLTTMVRRRRPASTSKPSPHCQKPCSLEAWPSTL